MNKEEGRRYLVAATLIIIVAALVAFWFLYKPRNYLELSTLDVGQGDAILIETVNDKTILVDGGAGKKVVRRISEELPFWQRKLDLVVLTHPHDDHFGGLIEVFKRYQVSNLLITGIETSDSGYKEFMSVVENSDAKVSIYNGIDKFTIDNLDIASLYPRSNVANKKYSNANNSSIVLKLSYADMDFLLMGDAEKPVEEELLVNEKNNLNAEVIKLGHHGADTSSTEEFLKSVKPTLALISVGKDNSYGHPSPLIMKRLERLGIKSYLTEDSGTIHLETDGHWLKSDQACLIGDCPL
ncbi:MAG: ComEC/Rec2 family competence protein [Candidatus Falkowbacteria bacterium]|nr:ComEC/Rec2 family competence protein [Candidatus Falkowbacteria bacterium]